MLAVTSTATPDRADDTRNTGTGRVKRLMAEWEPGDLKLTMAFHGVDEETARKLQMKYAMERRGAFCSTCFQYFEDGETVYRKRGQPGANSRFAGGPKPLQSFCHDCVSKWHRSWLKGSSEPSPCAGECGILVSSWYTHGYYSRNYEREGRPLITTCSSRCAELARNARRRRSAPTVCAAPNCGETFNPARADAQYCSNACRQRAYRQRKAA